MSDANPAPDRRALLQQALRAVDEMQARLAKSEAQKREPIAIVGMGLRYPGGAKDATSYWRILHDGVDATREVPADRWDADAYYDPDPDAVGKMITRRGGFLDRVDGFEPTFFGITPREAATLDPQQRLLLEVAWEALEDGGLAPDRLRGSQTGIFIGITTSDYAKIVGVGDADQTDVYAATGNALNAAAGRLAFVLGLHGPCMAVDTACSSSLTAVHLACQSLRNRECELALAGGVNIVLLPEAAILFSKWGMLAPDGRCKTFDASADGFVRSEGSGVVALKRLSDAQAAGDRILAVVAGSAVNQDGPSSGLTVPNGPAQQMVIRAALARAGVEPADVDYVEAHGTGTPLGDPIEVEALAAVMDKGRPADRPLLIGSVKTNIGHAEAASGVAGLIKVVLSLQNEEIPPHLHFKEPNPRIPWADYRVAVPAAASPWPRGKRRRLAGVSSFGFSGTNAHVLLEEAPVSEPRPTEGPERPLHLLAFSAKSEAGLRAIAERLAGHLETRESESLGDVAFTLGTGRSPFAHRAALIVKDGAEARDRLRALAEDREGPGVLRGRAASGEGPRVAFLFTGQGSQYAGMARVLHDTQPTFRKALVRCAEILAGRLEKPLLDVMFEAPGCEGLIDRTGYTQPALFAVEWALSELWRSWGLEPRAVLGHSVGEFVAAAVARALSVEDALGLLAERARLMEALPAGGSMVSLAASEGQVMQALAPHAAEVSIAAVNGPESVVISGPADAVQRVIAGLPGVKSQPLVVSHAFHSVLMEPMLAGLESAAQKVTHRTPEIDLVSNLTGKVLTAGELGPAYWRRHARGTVRYWDGLSEAKRLGCDAFIEMGPAPVLIGLAQRGFLDDASEWIPSLRKGRDDWRVMLEGLGRLWVKGARIDWAGFDHDYHRAKVALPTYPFQRQRVWVERSRHGAPAREVGPVIHPLLGRALASPLREVQLEVTLSPTGPAFLTDHRFYGTAVVPATAYIEMARAAAPEPGLVIEEMEIGQALLLPDGKPQTVQVVVTPTGDRTASFGIFSLGPDGSWRRHAAGRLVGASVSTAYPGLAEARQRCPEEVAVENYYARFPLVGVQLGPAFRGLQGVWRGAGEAVGRARLPLVADADAYGIHPALLDAAAFQLLGAALPDELAGSAFMPVQLGRLAVHGDVPLEVWSHVVVRAEGTAGLVADARLFDDEGRIVVELESLHLRRVSRDALERTASRFRDWIHELEWPLRPNTAPEGGSRGKWLVCGGGQGIGPALVAALHAAGQDAVLADVAEAFSTNPRDKPRGSLELFGAPFERRLEFAVTAGGFRLDPTRPEQVDRLIEEANAGGPLSGIVHLWALGPTEKASPIEAQARVCGSALHLAQAVAKRASPPRLWLVTQGAQTVAGEAPAVDQAPLWGFGRTVAAEQPDLACTCVDLDPASGSIESLVRDLLGPDSENQIAWRGGERHVARLVRRSTRGREANADEPRRLIAATPGVLESLAPATASRSVPGPGEVEVRVEAAGLNFRDVLNALGMYPGAAPLLGNECAGKVLSVGEGVVGVAPGDEVIALAAGALATHVVARASDVIAKPSRLTMEQAASVPTVFLTAGFGLHDLAGMARGERVLIHAAAGGVGLAAVQIAQRAGAEVFATAGSQEKREFLRSLGVAHVFDSRSTGYALGIKECTGGEGVDIILNSFVGEHIPLGLSLLRSGGRFLEIGKREVWLQERVREHRSDVSYHAYDLAEVFERDRALARRKLEEMVASFESGALVPLPVRVFPFADAAAAFQYMAQARHIGKVTVRCAPASSTFEARADATYLVTGGLRGLGLEVARWLVERGARNLMLIGRHPPSADAAAAVQSLEARGVRALVMPADVSDLSALRGVFARIDATLPPLRGIVHCAGVLDDAILAEQTWPRFARVMGPKIAGTAHLDALTRERALDFFVLFSSGSSLLGSPGQANYAAANAWMDALSHRRRAEGLPATAVNWGAWSEVGMAAGLDEATRRRLAARGLGVIPTADGLQALEHLLIRGVTEAAVLPIDWRLFLAQQATVPPVLSAFARETPAARAGSPTAAAAQGAMRDRLAQAPADERGDLLLAHVQEQVVKVLGLDAAQPRAAEEGLTEMGMDSLMAVELRNRLQASLALALPTTLAFEHPTVAAMTAYLTGELHLLGEVSLKGSLSESASAAQAEAAAKLDALSPDQLEASLLDELKDAGY